MTPDQRSGFRPDIEGLRGVAVLLVVFGHLTGWPRGGFVGVDVFFVVSGYLITGLLASERTRSGRISLRRFYVRRARRLLPAGVLVLVVTDVVAWLLLLPSRVHATVVDSLWAVGFLANAHFAQLGTDYFSLTRAPSAVQHYWSLSVEEQFYLLWPCLLLLALKVRGALATAAVIVAGSLAWSVMSTAHSPASAYFSSPARAWELGAGALLVLVSPRAPGWLAWLGGAGLLASVVVITPGTPVPGYALLLPVGSTVAILAAGGERIGLGAPPLRYVGKISYSLYLWHWPCFVLGSTLPGGTTPLGKAGLLGLALLLSVASYHLVEEPFRHPRVGRSRVAAPAYALVLVVALVAAWFVTAPAPALSPALAPVSAVGPVAGESAGPRPTSLSADLLAGLSRDDWPTGLDRALVDSGSPEWLHDKCLDVSDKNAKRCTYGSGARTVALIGDSVGVSWLPGLRAGAGAQIHVLTRRQCPNLRGFVSPSCAEHQDWALAAVRRLRPDTVVLSARYEGKPTPDQWREGTRRMVAAVAPYTKRVIVLAPPPEGANLQSCYTRLSTPRDCAEPVPQRWYDFATQEKAGAIDAEFVDTRQWFCVDRRCPSVVGDVPVMFDGRHLTAAFARRLAPQLAALLT